MPGDRLWRCWSSGVSSVQPRLASRICPFLWERARFALAGRVCALECEPNVYHCHCVFQRRADRRTREKLGARGDCENRPHRLNHSDTASSFCENQMLMVLNKTTAHPRLHFGFGLKKRHDHHLACTTIEQIGEANEASLLSDRW